MAGGLHDALWTELVGEQGEQGQREENSPETMSSLGPSTAAWAEEPTRCNDCSTACNGEKLNINHCKAGRGLPGNSPSISPAL